MVDQKLVFGYNSGIVKQKEPLMTYATIQEVNTSIMFNNFTNEQLNSVISAVKYARAQMTKEKARTFKVGSTVKFVSSKNGQYIVGTVEKIAIKYVTIRENGRTLGGLWRVPANMLEGA